MLRIFFNPGFAITEPKEAPYAITDVKSKGYWWIITSIFLFFKAAPLYIF